MLRKPLLVSSLVAALVLAPALALAFRSGPLPGHTGAPSINNGFTCSFCHVGPNTGTATFRITVPGSVYTPGSVIPVTVAFGGTLQNAAVNGYQMAGVVPNAGSALPGWTLVNADSQIVSDHVEHTQTGSTNRSSWTSYFATPASAPAGFTFYAAGNDANADGFNTGDHIYTTSVVMTPGQAALSLRAVPRIGATNHLDLDVPGDAGKPYVMAASFSNAGIKLGARTLPLFPDALFVLTVNNAVPAVFQGYQGGLDGSGRAAARLVAPNVSALAGVTLHHAFVVLDTQRPGGIGTISNPLPILLF